MKTAGMAAEIYVLLLYYANKWTLPETMIHATSSGTAEEPEVGRMSHLWQRGEVMTCYYLALYLLAGWCTSDQ
jgi:hypothetical protein